MAGFGCGDVFRVSGLVEGQRLWSGSAVNLLGERPGARWGVVSFGMKSPVPRREIAAAGLLLSLFAEPRVAFLRLFAFSRSACEATPPGRI